MSIGVQNNLADGGDVCAGVCGDHDDVPGHNQEEDHEADCSFRGHQIRKHAIGIVCCRKEAVNR